MDKKPTYGTSEEQDLFEKYLLDGMEAQERTDFESLLLSDKGLNTRFLEFKAMFRAIEEDGLRTKLEDFHKDLENDVPIRSIRPKFYRSKYGWAAAITLLMVMGGWWYAISPNSEERLFNAYFTPDPGLPTVMGNSDNYDFYEAMVDYKQGKYTTAIQKWEGLLPKKKNNDTLNYFLGAAYLANGEAELAIPYFERVIKKEETTFMTEAGYYKALAHLRNGDREAAEQSLERYSDEKGKLLLEDLKEE
ncbi:tetratricopeptide repeat protein [Flagellimonas crocea]|uniref:tetratricopeptide repeat protein n=1 Tax=Flagellimonas crocea TaxID=3067311 RepID=UPI00296F88D4|nr:tetratricopeptide repeat protein [Muricauda sp. DH64]